MTTLWVRADGSTQMGIGHIMRTIALAQAARRRGLNARFVIGRDPVASTLPSRFEFSVDELTDQGDTGWLDYVGADDLVYIDGYHFGSAFLAEVLSATPLVGVMTDFTEGTFPVPVIVNQNIVEIVSYDAPSDGQLLLGPRYALIREEFFPYRRHHNGKPTHALVTMGGSDITGVGADLAAAAVELHPELDVTLMQGPAAKSKTAMGVDVVTDPSDVASTFASADLAISAAGSTTWELLYLGVPTALVQVADNQATTGPGAQRTGAAIFLGRAVEAVARLEVALDALTETPRRRSLSSAAMRLVDGRGADRVLEALLRIPLG